MNRFTNRALQLLLLLLLPAGAFAQSWPMQSRLPNTEVPCNTQCTGKTVGYTAPLAAFTGRFLDSNSTGDYQQNFRTARAQRLFTSPDGRRIYMKLGAMVAAYDANSFFTRLEANEGLMRAIDVPLPFSTCATLQGTLTGACVNYRPGASEIFLRPDQYFYAEHASPWNTPFVDGQERLRSMDIDDQGYVYIAYGEFSWGIVKDDGKKDFSSMTSLFQYWPQLQSENQPEHILVIKTGDQHYYALVDLGGSNAKIWDVTTRSSPVKLGALAPVQVSNFAKNSTGDRIAFSDGSSVKIYSPEQLLTQNSTPIAGFAAPGGGSLKYVTSDGTNFFATSSTPAGLSIMVITPSGGSYTSSVFSTGKSNVTVVGLHAVSGYLTVAGYPADVAVYRIDTGGNLSEMPLPAYNTGGKYFPQYYSQAPPGYGAPQFYVQSTDASVLKYNNKTYLLYMAYGLADVYELKSGDSLSVNPLGLNGTANPNTPAAARSKVIYGDPLAFTASTSSGASVALTWNFGNPEAASGSDPNILGGVTGLPAVTHRYSGMGNGTLTPRHVTATAANDSNNFGDTIVTMVAPDVRIGLLGTNQQYSSTNALGTAPVVVGDKWVDASDGTVESHISSWTLYNALSASGTSVSTNGLPSAAQDVGACGPHFMSFTGHYGQNGDLTAPSSGSLGVAYTVRPFAASVDVSSVASGPNVTFTSSSRLTSDTTLLTPALLAGLLYKWDLLNPDGSVAASPVGPGGAFAAITPWVLPKSAVAQRGMKARLTITSPTDFGGACAGQISSSYSTAALNPPDPKITGGCTNGGPPCTFTASSISGVNPSADHWTYLWTVSPAATSSDSTSSTFNPSFSSAGTYTVTVTVTNDFGQAQAQSSATISVVQLCKTIIAGTDMYITYGASSGCSTLLTTPCGVNESIGFGVQAGFGYSIACGPHTFSWDLGDGTLSSAQTLNHSYAAQGTYNVKCIVNNGNGPVTLTQNVVVGPAPNPCGTISPNVNVLINYNSNSGACSSGGGTCAKNDPINFTAAAFGNYSFSCGTHQFSWSWGDGQGNSGQSQTHTYVADGTYTVTLNVTQPNGTVVPITKTITVGTGGNTCGTMVPNTNVFLNYSGTTCSSANSTAKCAANEALGFSAIAFGNYTFGCGTHTYAWDFGDNTTGTGQNPFHTYSTPKTYTVKLTITNPNNQQAILTQNITVEGANSCPSFVAGANIFVDFFGTTTGCTETTNNTTDCHTNEDLLFSVKTFQYQASCVTAQSWDFGDGSQSTQSSVTHKYTEAKTYTVTLRVTVNGQVTPIVQTVRVTSIDVPPVTSWDFQIQPLVFNGEAVANGYIFKATSVPADAVKSWNWNFGDSGTPVQVQGGSIQTHIYSDSKVHTVTLTIAGVPGAVTHQVGGASRRRAGPH